MNRDIEFEREFDFNAGVKIPSSTINGWHTECLNEIKNGSNRSSRKCGNSLLMAEVIQYDWLDYPIVKVIEITNGHKEYTYKLIENNIEP